MRKRKVVSGVFNASIFARSQAALVKANRERQQRGRKAALRTLAVKKLSKIKNGYDPVI